MNDRKVTKKHHIRIVGSGSTCNASISTCDPRSHLISVNIRDDWSTQNNKYISRLENDLKIFNLNVIKDYNDETILNAIKEKKPGLDISKIEIVKKSDYSHFSESFSVNIKVKNGDDYYSRGPIKNNITFNTEIKLKELSDKLNNDPLVIEWLNHIKDYNMNLPKKITSLKEYVSNQKWNAKNVEKEIIKGYIRDLSQIIRLIEHQWKIEELNNTVQNLKSDINNLNNSILNLNNEKKCKSLFSKMSSAANLLPLLGKIISGIISLNSSVCEINNA
ncbi:hypothetical protein [Spiroplasma endosymbiont of Phyllotreta cruciferae]|uniref:hypothetical protein n=1 Tax=Spiroplasma endosymbiont of Phyllotreta cruciferae TaxID=2886375 RepID=UPI0020A07164|nr:hypothetical protein [Spiroplasma endosymbiont of Phyllotreta cruciferae]